MKAYLLLILHVILSLAADLYEVLELTPEASEHDIKKAFRRLSIQYHPDKNPGNKEAHQRYLDVNRAYEILLDSEQRQIYDLYGEEGLQEMKTGFRNKQKGPNAQADIHVTLEELYNGAEKSFQMQKKVICKGCRGSGSKDGKMKMCKTCNGMGQRMQNVNMGIGFSVQMQVPCDRCGGKGKVSSGNCPQCYGARTLPQTKNLKIDIEKGMYDAQNIVFKGESEQSPDYLPGDVIFTLRQEKHPFFIRKGDDLHMDLKITLKEAIMGFKKRIRHLDNHYVEVHNVGITQPFSIKTIKEEGMPIHTFPSQHGDLHIKFIVDLPKSLNSSDKELLKQIFAS